MIEFSGAATANGYRLRNDDGGNWNDTENRIIEWSMAYDENYVVYIAAQTKNGFRYIYYTSSQDDRLGSGSYIHHGLQASSKDGTWQTIIRDLAYDLKEAQPDNELEAILGFFIRGSGRVDDIRTRSSLPPSLDSDGDTLTDVDEIEIYGTHPYKADSDGDGLSDAEELSYWGSAWNSDTDGDGIVNILDADSDGDGMNDGIEVAQGTDPGDSTSYPTIIVYENAEHGTTTGWDIYDNDPSGAFIDNVYDDERDSRVIDFNGAGTSNGYRLLDAGNRYWNDTNYTILQWSLQYTDYVVYVAVQTTEGFRYLYYTAADHDRLGDSTYIHPGLGRTSNDNSWRTFVRDLNYDLKEAQPANSIEAVLGFLIRGNGRVDDIMTRESLPADLDSDGDGLTDVDEITIYSTHPYRADTDDDTLQDGEELAFWGNDWNNDPDGDGLVNLVDSDSDNDGILDGREADEGTDPADPASFPTSITYEDGNDATLAGWDIYDHDPAGASINSVYDSVRNSQVVSFSGSGTANGYRLRNEDFSYWYDTTFTIMEWSMAYNEGYVVYIAAQTKEGFRYIYYTSAEDDRLGTGTYVHHGLGSASRDGNWHTIVRDLEADLQEAQPDNELEAVLGFLIRGSGRVDDIKTRESLIP